MVKKSHPEVYILISLCSNWHSSRLVVESGGVAARIGDSGRPSWGRQKRVSMEGVWWQRLEKEALMESILVGKTFPIAPITKQTTALANDQLPFLMLPTLQPPPPLPPLPPLPPHPPHLPHWPHPPPLPSYLRKTIPMKLLYMWHQWFILQVKMMSRSYRMMSQALPGRIRWILHCLMMTASLPNCPTVTLTRTIPQNQKSSHVLTRLCEPPTGPEDIFPLCLVLYCIVSLRRNNQKKLT